MRITEYYNKQVKCYLPGGVHQNFNYPWRDVPVYSVKTNGSHVWDMDGKEYIDLFSYHGATILGNVNEDYSAALSHVMSNNMGACHTDFELETMKLLHNAFKSAEMMRFGVSESLMIQDAIRLARVYMGKRKFLRFENQYLGCNENLLGSKAGDFRRPKGMGDIGLEECYVIRWNDQDLLEKIMKEHDNEMACVVMEPISVTHGSIEPANGFLAKVRRLCDEYNVLLIFDETNSGIRAHFGGAQELYGVYPDLTVLGKSIGGGVPIGILAGRKDIMNLYQKQEVTQAGEFNGYSLGMAAISTTMHILFDDNMKNYRQLLAQAQKLRDKTLEVAKDMKFPLVVQGPLLCGAIHCSEEELKDGSDYVEEMMVREIILNDCMQRNGIIVESPLTLYPNLKLSDADIEEYGKGMQKAIRDAMEILEA